MDYRHLRRKYARYKSAFHDGTQNGRESLTFVLTSECLSSVRGTIAKFCLSALSQVIGVIVLAFHVLSHLMNYAGQNSSPVAVRHLLETILNTKKRVLLSSSSRPEEAGI